MTATEKPIRVIANRTALASILASCCGVVNPRSPKPVLACVKLEAEDDVLRIMASDLEVSIEFTLSIVQIESVGSICVPAEQLRNAVDKCESDTVTLSMNGEKFKVADSDGETNIMAQPASEYPPHPQPVDGTENVFEGKQILLALQRTSFAVSKDPNRYAICGTLFEVQANKTVFVATDGRRLSMSSIDVKSKTTAKAIVPPKVTKLVASMIEDDDVTVMIGTNQISFASGDWTLTSNLIEGTFPPYEDHIGIQNSNKMTGGATSFASAVGRAALMSDEIQKGIRLSLSKDGAKLSAAAAARGDSTVRYPCKYDGSDMTIGFNHEFISDAIKACGADEITIHLEAHNRAVKFTIPDPNWVYILMPVNLE